jgi:hypothetical protein
MALMRGSNYMRNIASLRNKIIRLFPKISLILLGNDVIM